MEQANFKKVFAAGPSGAYVMPVGDITNYSPVTLTYTTNSDPRTIGIRVTDAQHPSDGTVTNYISRYWSFTDDQAGSYILNAIFTYINTAADLNGAAVSLRGNRWDGASWTQYNTVNGAGTMTLSSLTNITAPLNNTAFTGRVNPAATYNWIVTDATASWTDPFSWSPARLSPQPADILVFNNNGTTTAINVPTQIIGQLILSNNSNVSLQSAAAAQTLTIAGDTGTDLDIPAGSTLQISSEFGNQLGIVFNTATADVSVAGSLIINQNTALSNSFSATNSNTVVSGSVTNNGGTITSTAANLGFSAGSVYNHARNNGAIPTATWNGTSVINVTGITVAAPTGFNQTFGDLNIICSVLTGARVATLTGAVLIQGDLNISGTSALNTMTLNTSNQNLTVNGTTTVNAFGILLDNNNTGTNRFDNILTINADGQFLMASTSVTEIRNGISNNGIFTKSGGGSVTFTTNASQPISGSSVYTFTSGDLIISDPASLDISSDINFSGTNLTNNSNAPNAFNASAGKFTFTLLGNQNINGSGTGSVTFYNLTAGGNSTKTINIPVDITNDLIINNGVILGMGTTAKTINVIGNMTVDGALDFGTVAAKTLNLTGNLIDIGGAITMTGAGLAHQLNLDGASNAITTLTTTAGSGSSVNYIHSGDQQVFNSNGYQIMNLSGGGIKTLQGNSTINSILTLTDGILRLGASNLTIANNATNAIQGTFNSTNMIETNGSGGLIRNALTTLPIDYPVGSGNFYSPVSITATSATTGNIKVIAVDSVMTSNFISKYWDVITSVGPKTITATFNYDPAEIAVIPTNIWYKTPLGSWVVPTGSSSFGTNSFTITGTTNMTTTSTYWTAGALETYYSYQTGDWNTPNTWTFDPSGTLQIGTTVPGINDKVIILEGRTVSLSSDITTEGLDITIDAGGFLNQTTKKFTKTLTALRGQGTLQLATTDFPSVTTNTFINAGGGTTEYNNAYDFDLPSTPATYNNLTINAPGFTGTQLNNLVLNGNLNVKQGTYRINDNLSATKLSLTINGNVAVEEDGAITVGNGVTNPDIASVTAGGAAPFINYYTYFHTVIIKGDFTNNGTVRFTNLQFPVYDAFPSTVPDATTGAVSVYFQGAADNVMTLNGTTDFYNLIVDKGTDQTFKLTVNSSDFYNFRLFGANILAAEAVGANANLRKALWIRNGTLVLDGSVIIPSLTEGTDTGSPNSDFYIPSNGALVLDGTDVIVFGTADDYQEVNTAYNVSGTDNGSMGISTGGSSAIEIYGKLQINDGYLSTRESGGLITSGVASGQLIINGGTIDAKQFLSSTGSSQYTQTGGLVILRGRFQRTPSDYSTIANLIDVSSASLNKSRVLNGINSAYGTFNLENATNIFNMTGGIIRIYDVCGTGAGEEEVFDVKSSVSNINVTGGSLELLPDAGLDLPDAVNLNLFSTAPLNNLLINRSGSTSAVSLSSPLTVLNDFNISSGDFTANNNNVTIGGDFTIANGTSYAAGTNTTTLNGSGDQILTADIAAPLTFNNLTIDKSAGDLVNLAGSQNTIDVIGNLRLVLATLNDNGKTVNIGGNIFNSGIHTGSGKLVLNGTLAQTIDGNGVFENVELNNATTPVSLAANMTINGDLTFSQDKLFNIGTYNLKLGSLSSILNGGSDRYIQTAGNAGDGGVTKSYSTSATFAFPVGAPTITPAQPVKYTPAYIGFSSDPAVLGSITVIPVGYEHPNTTTNGQSLTYFWRVTSSGFSGIAPNSVIHSFVYNNIDVVGTEANYVPALYRNSDFTWRTGTNDNPPINISTDSISDWITPTNSADFLDADYTAGESAFGAPQIYYSRQSGLWSNLATWSLTSHTVDNPPAVVPGINDIVIIGDKDSVSLITNLTVADQGVQNCASLQIESGSALDIGYNPGCNFGMVVSHPSGNGNFRLTASQTSGSIFNFPDGDFSDFNVNKGTTEFYSTNATSGTIFILPYDVTSYGTVILSPLGGSNIIMPNNSATTIYGNLITRGQDARSWLTMTWSGVTYANSNPAMAIVPKIVTVKGDLLVQGGSFGWYQNGAIEQKIVVEGDVVVDTFAGIDNWGGSTNNSISIGGSLINNTTNTVVIGTSRCYVNLSLVNTTFFGDTNETIFTANNTPYAPAAAAYRYATLFNKVTVNKGNSQSATLTCLGGTINNPVTSNDWLTLVNGTFRYMLTDPLIDFGISTTTPFNIPATAGLYVDYSNASSRNVLIANSSVNTNDLILDGKLTLVNGNVYVGPVAAPNNNNDIEYSGSGASAIEIQGGNLVVNGQIRRPAASTNGILSYVQSGGNVTINGNNLLATRAKLEVLNSGSVFNMSGGNLTIVRGGGGTTFGDLYLRPGTSTITGGTILFAHNISGVNQTYSLEANVPLFNVTITGRTTATAANATVGLMVSPLLLNGSLTLTNNRSFFNSNNINVSIKGDLNNSGTYNYGTNLTTFNGSIQSVTGTTVTNFYDLNVSPTSTLTVNNNFTVNHNLTIGSGNLVLAANRMNLLGNILNSGSYTDDNSTGGISLSGASQQQITGTGGFGRLELNNALGAKTNNDITLQGDLVLTQGILDINKNRLTLSQNSAIDGASFGLTKYIKSEGVISSLGVRKFFTNTPQTFTFPVGVSGKYTPADIDITASATVGSININPVNNYHPSVIDPDSVLKFYWQIESSGISAFDGTLLLQYITGDVYGTESDYVAARLELPSNIWNKAPVGPATDNVDETNNQITFVYSGSNNLNGEYTAGEDTAIPGEVPTYQTNKDGNWSDPAIWTPLDLSPPCPAGGPNGANVIIDHIVSVITSNIFAQNTQINNKLKILAPTSGHNLGSVDGDGTLYLENGNLPGGDYTAFTDCAGDGTVEYGGTGTYTIIATQFNNLPNMFVTGTGTRILPNKDLTICKRLVIDGPTLDNSVNFRKLTILGTMERYNTGAFKSGIGVSPASTVTFAGSALQTLGGPTGDFTGSNKFNNLEITNPFGLEIGTNGLIEVNNELLLTNGIITTTSSNKLTLLSTSSSSVVPSGGAANSFINGPLIKSIINGGSFLFPIGKGATKGHDFTLTSNAGSTLLWTAEYFTPNPTSTSLDANLEVANSLEYWSVSTTASVNGRVKIGWNSTSDITPLMTQNGITDMRVAEQSAGLWNELLSTTSGNDNIGDVATTNSVNLSAVAKNFTTASITSTLARASLTPLGAVCGTAGIPVTFTTHVPISLNYTLDYTVNGTLQSTIIVSSLPYVLPTPVPGSYRLTGFTYNNGADIGVTDGTIVDAYTNPPDADAGPNQSHCGVSGTILQGNNPAPFAGLWTVLLGSGGTFVNNAIYNTVFTGVLGETYTLRWTINNGACTSDDDVIISFPVVAPVPGAFTSGPTQVCQGSNGYVYTVPNDPGVSYFWIYSGGGCTINGTGNSVSLDFAAGATNGTLSVTATNACGTSAPRSIVITVNALPAPSLIGPASVCPNATAGPYSTTNNPLNSYSWIISGGVINGPSTGSSVMVDWGNAGPGTVSVTETSPAGCTFTTPSYNVTISDTEPPVIVGCPANTTVNNDPGLCSAIVTWFEPTATDNCTAAGSLIWTRSHIPGDVFPVGTTLVTYNATDASGNTSLNCTFNVTVTDNTPSVISLPAPPVLIADASCQAIMPAIAATATDNCTIPVNIIISQVPAAGTVIGAGVTSVSITATDQAGNISASSINVTVLDNTPPTLTPVSNRDENLSGTCNFVIPDYRSLSTASDNCGAPVVTQSPIVGTVLSGAGTIQVITLTATDGSGNTANTSFAITLKDVTPPVANCKNITVMLDVTGHASIVAADVNNGSNDNCGIAGISINRTDFDCTDVGVVPVTLTVTDNSGNTNFCTSNVTVTSSLNVSATLNSCNAIPGIAALFEPNVVGGDGNYTYFWDGLNDAVDPFMEITLVPLSLTTSNTSTQETPLLSWFLPDGPQSVQLTVTDGNGCTDSYILNFTKNGLTTDNVSVNYSDACEGEIINYLVGYEPDATYAWEVENGTILSAITDTNTVDIEWDFGVTEGVVRTNITQPSFFGDCGSSVIDSVTVYLTPSPSFVAPVLSVCQGSSQTYTLSGTYNTYNWTITGGSITSGGAGNNFATVLWTTAGTGNVEVEVISTAGCSATTDVDVAVYKVTGSIDSQLNESCTGNADGEVTVSGSGGLGSHYVSINGGVTYFNSPHTFTGLSAGPYNVLVKDDLNCTSNLSVNIIVDDIIPPTAICKDITVNLDGSGNASIVVADVNNGSFDNCGIASMTIDKNIFDCTDLGPNNVTLTVTDVNSNVSNCVAVVTVADNLAPAITCPGPVSVQCISSVPAAYANFAAFTFAGGTASDNCGIDALSFILLSEVDDGNTCPELITRTYQITDVNGNSATCTQTITIDDTTNPTASNPAPVTVQCTSAVPVPNITVVTDEADNCTAAPVVAWVSDVSDGNTCPEVITRTYSVTDACGNSINVTQTITIDDTTNPTASNPAPVTVQCTSAVPVPNITVVTDEADNCTAAPVVAFVSDVSNGATCPEVITRTYSVTDACGNSINVTQTITIDDTTNPTASNPAPVTVQCASAVPVPNITVVTDEADNCTAAPVVAWVSDVSNGATCPEVITRTYSVTDACGNSINVTQTITIDDTTNPTASNPAPVTVQCTSAVPVPNITVVTDEADNCTAAPVVAFVSDVSDGNTCPEVITRTYSVTDACGNSINVTQTITIDDTTNPTASNPAPVTVQCASAVPVPNITVVTDEADNCTAAPVVAWVSDVSNGATCPEVITRTYSVTDACGNSINVTQTITIDDTTNPTASNPAPVTVQCTSAVPVPNITVVTDEADNCTAAPVVAWVSDVSNGATCPEVITRTYSVTDACGNSINVTQTITIDDTTNPTASNPAPVTVQCTSAVPVPNITVVTDEADNCTAAPVVAFVSDVSDGNTCPEVITRTYSVTDACGNSINVTQTITIDDTTNPTASNPAPVTVQCTSAVPVPNITVVTDEADNCTAAPVVAFVSDVSNGATCPEVITRTYSVTDACGNSINVTQTITIDDTTNPTASNPAPVTVQCTSAVPVPNITVVTDEADNCTAAPVVAFVSDVSNGATCPEVITRTYSVTDACGNSINVTQTITIDDTTNPTASNPAPVTVQCTSAVPVPNITVVTDEADNCTAAPVVAFVSDVSDGNTCPEVITRTYSVTDACGNSINVTQTITIDDTTNPTASNPAPVTVQCASAVPVPNITVVTDEADNCTAAPVVAWVSDVSNGATCPEVITRTYSVTDACGNSINVTQTITIDDTTNPTASNPAPVTVQCTSAVPVPNITVVTDEADNCTAAPVVAWVSDVSDGNTCPEVITRTYSVTDACGNSINVTQTITIDDTTNPTASNPAPVTVQCTSAVPVPNITVVTDEADNCTAAPVVAFVSDVSNGATCPEVITRTYSVTDACGNSINVTQTITIDDTTNPTASNPAPVTVQCTSAVPVPNITVVTDEADNCTAAPVVAWVSDVSNGATCPEVITRTYSVTDACGNSINVTQTITIDDTTNPTASNPAPVTVQCTSAVPVPNITVVTDEADNCTAAPVVAWVSDVSDGNTCPEVITRTYSVTDACGNSINVTQTITIDDTTNPTASNPAPVNGTVYISCSGTKHYSSHRRSR